MTATRTSDWAACLGKAGEAVAAALLRTPLVESHRLGQGALLKLESFQPMMPTQSAYISLGRGRGPHPRFG